MADEEDAPLKMTHTRTAAYAPPGAEPPPEDQAVDDEDDGPPITMTHTRTAAYPGPPSAEAAAPDADAFDTTKRSPKADSGMTDLIMSQPAGKKKGGRMSLLGSNLQQKHATGGGKTSANPTSSRTSSEIVRRYAAEVKEADRNRKQQYMPMDKQVQCMPAGLDIAKDMQAELQNLTSAVGGAHLVSKAAGWDALLGKESFQKRMQFLHEHARTGNFIEQYGVDGMYEGEFVHGMRHGKGRYEFREEVYDGDWKWDQRHGWGCLTCNDGNTMKGEWQNGKLHGFACVVDKKDTVIYEGEFHDGKRHGLGRQVFESGDMYDGGWQVGRLHDRGVYYFTNGDRLYGMWKEGIYDGVGVFHYADGSISRREYRDGLLMSVQDYEKETQRFGKTLTRDGMQKHTRDRDFPKDVFLLNQG